jgi:hypothetical protein
LIVVFKRPRADAQMLLELLDAHRDRLGRRERFDGSAEGAQIGNVYEGFEDLEISGKDFLLRVGGICISEVDFFDIWRRSDKLDLSK